MLTSVMRFEDICARIDGTQARRMTDNLCDMRTGMGGKIGGCQERLGRKRYISYQRYRVRNSNLCTMYRDSIQVVPGRCRAKQIAMMGAR